MLLETILRQIERRLRELDLSADAASKMAGKPDAIRNMRRAVAGKAKAGGITTTTLFALARVLKVHPSELVNPGHPIKKPCELVKMPSPW